MGHIFLSSLFSKDASHPEADNWNENKANSCNLQQARQLIEENYLEHLSFQKSIFDGSHNWFMCDWMYNQIYECICQLKYNMMFGRSNKNKMFGRWNAT